MKDNENRRIVFVRRYNNKIVNLYDIDQIFPFFIWKKCSNCGYSVKAEIMWRVKIRSRKWRNISCKFPISKKYFCTSCFSDSVSGKEKLNNHCKNRLGLF